MRTMLFAVLTTMGIGLIGISGATAMPASGPALLNAAEDLLAIDQVAVVVRHRAVVVHPHAVAVRHPHAVVVRRR